MVDQFFWWRTFQGDLIFGLWHECCWLLLTRSAVGEKKQNKKFGKLKFQNRGSVILEMSTIKKKARIGYRNQKYRCFGSISVISKTHTAARGFKSVHLAVQKRLPELLA